MDTGLCVMHQRNGYAFGYISCGPQREDGYASVTPPSTKMIGAWKRLKTLSGGALRVQRCSSSSASAETAATAEPSPVKYENVRKLVVGLGNPGDKYARTRHNIGSSAVANFLDTYAHDVLGKKLTLQHEDNNHGDVARFLLTYQQDVEDEKYNYRVDDLVNLSSQRRKDKTLEEGVPHPSVNVALLNPTTYMNRSGVAVKTFMNSHKWRLKKNAMSLNRQDELLVITDDVSLPFGTCRFKGKGGPGGQNGIRDIIKCVGSERFARLKIGVGAPEWFAGGQSGAPSGTAMDKFVLARFNADEQDQLPLLLEYVNELLRLFLHRGLSTAATIANSNDLASYKKQFRSAQSPNSSKK